MFLKTSILWELCYNILLVDDFSVQTFKKKLIWSCNLNALIYIIFCNCKSTFEYVDILEKTFDQPRLNKVNLCFVEGGFIWLTENMPPDPFTEFYAGPWCAHYVYG